MEDVPELITGHRPDARGLKQLKHPTDQEGQQLQQSPGSTTNFTQSINQSKRKTSYANGQTNLGHKHKAPDHNHEATVTIDMLFTTVVINMLFWKHDEPFADMPQQKCRRSAASSCYKERLSLDYRMTEGARPGDRMRMLGLCNM